MSFETFYRISKVPEWRNFYIDICYLEEMLEALEMVG
jgi:hypothetical protein